MAVSYHIHLWLVSWNPQYDLKEFNFIADLVFGQQGEALVQSVVSSLGTGAVEVKSDRYRNGRMVVETHQHRGHVDWEVRDEPEWKLSGINVTTAEWWVYVFAMDGSFVVISTDRLKKFLRTHRGLFNEDTKRIFAKHSDNPAKGWILEPTQVIDLLVNPAYD